MSDKIPVSVIEKLQQADNDLLDERIQVIPSIDEKILSTNGISFINFKKYPIESLIPSKDAIWIQVQDLNKTPHYMWYTLSNYMPNNKRKTQEWIDINVCK